MALRAGGPYIADPLRLVRDMRPSTLGTWLAFARVSPFGDARGDLQAAIVASSIANYAGKVLKSGAAKPLDFMPYAEHEEETPESLSTRILNSFQFLKVVNESPR